MVRFGHSYPFAFGKKKKVMSDEVADNVLLDANC